MRAIDNIRQCPCLFFALLLSKCVSQPQLNSKLNEIKSLKKPEKGLFLGSLEQQAPANLRDLLRKLGLERCAADEESVDIGALGEARGGRARDGAAVDDAQGRRCLGLAHPRNI
jgi:hypothetical protein